MSAITSRRLVRLSPFRSKVSENMWVSERSKLWMDTELEQVETKTTSLPLVAAFAIDKNSSARCRYRNESICLGDENLRISP